MVMMVSVEQLTALIQFMECHTEVALGRLNRSKEGRSQTKRLWEECAETFNSVSADCVHKTSDQWRMYYNEYKSKLMKKIKIEKTEIKATGGGPSKKTPLTPLQERLYDILGRDFGEPLPGIQHNPLSQHDDAMPLLRPPSVEQDQEQYDHEEVVVIEVPATDDICREQWSSRDPPASTSRELASDTTDSASRECATGPIASTSRELPTDPIPSTSRELATDPIPSTSRELPLEAATPDPIRQATPAARRKRRRRRRSQISQLNPATENEPAMLQATERLEAMEKLNAEATRELAQATHRQAAALESIGEVLRELINQPNQGRSSRLRFIRNRLIYSSESD